MFSFDLIFE